MITPWEDDPNVCPRCGDLLREQIYSRPRNPNPRTWFSVDEDPELQLTEASDEDQ